MDRSVRATVLQARTASAAIWRPSKSRQGSQRRGDIYLTSPDIVSVHKRSVVRTDSHLLDANLSPLVGHRCTVPAGRELGDLVKKPTTRVGKHMGVREQRQSR